jgi:hypothetical protein
MEDLERRPVIRIFKASAITDCEGCNRKRLRCHFVRNSRFKVTDTLCLRCVKFEIDQSELLGETRVIDEREK